MYNDRLNGLVTGHKTLVEYILWLFYVQWVWRNLHELIMFLLLLTLSLSLSAAEAEESLKAGTKALRAVLKGTRANMLAPLLFSSESGLGADILAASIRQFAGGAEAAQS